MFRVPIKQEGRFFQSNLVHCVGAGYLVFALCACGPSGELKRMGFQGPPPIVPDTKVIANFMGLQCMAALYKDIDELPRDTTSCRVELTQEKFLEYFEAFKCEPIPLGFKSDRRERDKNELVRALDALIEGVNNHVSDEEIRRLAEPIRPAVEAFMKPTNY